MKKIGKFLIGTIETIIIFYTILITSCLIFVNEYGFTQFGNYTIIQAGRPEEKLLNNVKDGDLLIIRKDEDFPKGTVVYYYSVVNEKYFIKSAPVKEIKDDGFGKLYTLEVENNSEINAINEKKLIGNSISIHKGLGKILNVLESRIGFLFLVLLPIMIIFILHVYNFVIILKYEKVEDIIKDDDEKETKKVHEEKHIEELIKDEEVEKDNDE